MEEKKTKTWLSEIHRHEWYRDTKGRTWVVTGFRYEDGLKSQVHLLQLGCSEEITQPYGVVQKEISEGRMRILVIVISNK